MEYHFVIVDYLCRAQTDRIMHGSDADDVRWVSVEELPLFRLSEKAAGVVRKARALN